jgi:hypothetical protein
MRRFQQRRVWFLVAAIAVGVALLFMLVPQTHHGSDAAWVALLPLLFVGVISPLSLLSQLAYLYLGRTPATPVLPASFQRPPPSSFA